MKRPIDFAYCADRIKAISDPNRLELLNRLFDGEATVSELAAAAGMPLVKASHHLLALLRANIVTRTKSGRFVYYALHPDVMKQDGGKPLKQINLGCCSVSFEMVQTPVQIAEVTPPS